MPQSQFPPSLIWMNKSIVLLSYMMMHLTIDAQLQISKQAL